MNLYPRVLSITTTTGTGALTITGSSVAGYQDVSAAYAVSDTFSMVVVAVDTNGIPTGEWEECTGTLATGTTISRSSVIGSSNAGAAVNFSAGTKYILVTPNHLCLSAISQLTTSGATGRTLFGAASASDARTTLELGTAATKNTGTSAGNVVELETGGKLPAVDGSQLTNLPSGGAITSAVNTWTAAQRGAYSTLTYGGTITPDFSLANQFRVQLSGNPTLGVPTNLGEGQSGAIDMYQDTTGGRTVGYSWCYQAAYGVLPAITATARAKVKVFYSVDVYKTSAVTITIASPGVVSWTAHGLMAGQQLQLTTTGALPTGLAANTTYFVVPVDANSFQLAATQSGSAINTSGSQSGTHTATAISIVLSFMQAVA